MFWVWVYYNLLGLFGSQGFWIGSQIYQFELWTYGIKLLKLRAYGFIKVKGFQLSYFWLKLGSTDRAWIENSILDLGHNHHLFVLHKVHFFFTKNSPPHSPLPLIEQGSYRLSYLILFLLPTKQIVPLRSNLDSYIFFFFSFCLFFKK